MYDTTRADYAPYREYGYGALGQMAQMYGVGRVDASGKRVRGTPGGSGTFGFSPDDFQTSPGYEFRRNEGLKAIERSAAARGGLRSGGTMKAMARYADNLASSEYENYANRLASIAGIGQSATGSTAAAGAQAAGGIGSAYANMGNAYQAAGNARASAYQNTGNAINQTVGNLASAYLYNQGWGKPGGTA